MKILCVFGKYNYGDPHRGLGYEYCNFIPALIRLGHDVSFFDVKDRSIFSDFRELNYTLVETVATLKPDVILAVQMLYEVWSETWNFIRAHTPVILLNWTTDDSWRYESFSRFIAPCFHAMTTTYNEALHKYQRDGFDHILLTQWAANADTLAAPIPAEQCQYDVSFIGSAHGNRRQVIEALNQRGIAVNCFGHGWESGSIPAEDIPLIIRSSRISLNLANSALIWRHGLPRRHNQIKARVFEVPGAGGFLMTESAPDLIKFFKPGREIAVFHTIDELATQIRYYLEHPQQRDTLAQAGYARTQNEHTYDIRMAELLNFGICHRDTARTNWDLDRWQGEFQSIIAQHKATRFEERFRTGLVWLCARLWGKQRGWRAARRITFELSWRLAGARTYSATGWPGKLFYSVS